MSHFAKVENGIVTSVIVAEQDFINTGAVGDPASWVQTSYNTRGGVHYGPDGQPDGGIALRKNYAGIGYTYDAGRDAFYSPKPYNSWVLDESTCYWNAPVALPADSGQGDPPKRYIWNEETVNWVEVTF
jgi:hypothetical protein